MGVAPRIRLKFGRVLACRTQTARNCRVRDASRPETGTFHAASARFSRLADSGFGAAESRFLCDIKPRPDSSFSEFPDRDYSYQVTSLEGRLTKTGIIKIFIYQSLKAVWTSKLLYPLQLSSVKRPLFTLSSILICIRSRTFSHAKTGSFHRRDSVLKT